MRVELERLALDLAQSGDVEHPVAATGTVKFGPRRSPAYVWWCLQRCIGRLLPSASAEARGVARGVRVNVPVGAAPRRAMFFAAGSAHRGPRLRRF